MTNSRKQQHGIGSLAPDEKIVGKPGGIVEPGVKQYGIFKKIKKGVKKVLGSKLGKAALIGGGLWGLNKFGLPGGGAGKGWWSKGLGRLGIGSAAAGNTAREAAIMRNAGGTKAGGLWNWVKGNKGKAALLGLGAAGTILPFMAKGPDEEEEGESWSVTPSSIADIRLMARNQDPSLAFMPSPDYVQSGFYNAANGGIARLANGGQPAEAQAEQMLRMEYQKYRNQGGTMSYQQFKMQVLQQAQAQGPMAQGQPQRGGYQGGELVEDASMIEETPTGMMAENIEEVQGEPTREQMEVLAMEIFQLRLEELDEEQLMVVYQAAMEQQPREEEMQEEAIQFAAHGGRIGLNSGGGLSELEIFKLKNLGFDVAGKGTEPFGGLSVLKDILRVNRANGGLMGTHVAGYSTPPGYNRFDYPSGGARVGKAEGGVMSLGGMEKDYRNEGGFVALGGEEKADDVPARLSKNEFVFTADAVRAAGGGDIDQGAEVMQNVMTNLESGGEISEDSQGAQGMYNNMKQLETRVI